MHIICIVFYINTPLNVKRTTHMRKKESMINIIKKKYQSTEKKVNI